MSNYIEKVKQIREDHECRREEYLKKAEAARKDAAALRALRGDVINEGCREEYANLCHEIEYHDRRAEFAEKQAQIADLNLEEYISIWEEYAKEYNKRMKKKVAYFEKIRKEFALAYVDMLENMAEGNQQLSAVHADLDGSCLKNRRVTEIITQLSLFSPAEVSRGDTAEMALTTAALSLDANRVKDLKMIECGGWPSDTWESLEDVARSLPQKPIFFYGLRDESEEADHARRLRGASRSDEREEEFYLYGARS